MGANIKYRLLAFAVVVSFAVFSVTPNLSWADEGIPIRLRHLDNPKIEALAEATYLAWTPSTQKISKPELKRIVRESTYYAWAHISDDSIPELVIQFGDAPSCGNIGCETHIFRKTGKGYELICADTMLDSDSAKGGPIILPQIDNGYHVLDAGEVFIRWNATKDQSGQLCTDELNPNFGLKD